MLVLISLDWIAVLGVVCELPAVEDVTLTLLLCATNSIKSQLLVKSLLIIFTSAVLNFFGGDAREQTQNVFMFLAAPRSLL